MEIKIDLPVTSLFDDDGITNYDSAKQFLKQFELSVHHAQKALQSMQEIEGDITENIYVSLRVQDVDTYDEENKLSNPARAFIEIQGETS